MRKLWGICGSSTEYRICIELSADFLAGRRSVIEPGGDLTEARVIEPCNTLYRQFIKQNRGSGR
jgi:hypothetical protein